VLASLLGVPGIDLSRSALDLRHLDLVPREVAESEHLLPLEKRDGRLFLALADPDNPRVVEELRLVSGLEAVAHVALQSSLEKAIPAAYAARAAGQEFWRGQRVPPDVRRCSLALLAGLPDVPAAAGDDGIVIEVDETPGGGEEVLASVKARAAEPLVLVADGDAESTAVLARALGGRGWRVQSTPSGREALRLAAELRPDCVLVDAGIADVHGLEVCRTLKKDPRLADIPVVVTTSAWRGWRFAEDIRETFGADDFVEKPFRTDDLLRRVEAHLRRAAGEPHRPAPDAEAQYALGLLRLGEGRVSEALEALDRAVSADPFSPRVHYAQGRALQAAGDAYRALGAYERAVELDPGHFAALRSLAVLYQQKGFRRKAVEAWERAIPAAPDEDTRARIRSGLLALL